MNEANRIHPGARIGRVHLKVSNLERSIAFYQNVFGFEITQRYEKQAAFLSAGGYHHHIGLNTWSSQDGAPAPTSSSRLFHVSILYPSRKELSRAVVRVLSLDIPLNGA